MAKIETPIRFGFPLFTKDYSTDYIIKNKHIRISDLWAFWHYTIRMFKKKNTSCDLNFMLIFDYIISWIILGKQRKSKSYRCFYLSHNFLLLFKYFDWSLMSASVELHDIAVESTEDAGPALVARLPSRCYRWVAGIVRVVHVLVVGYFLLWSCY